ncbi:TlpA disulfide reductase family protein [Mesorhizobium sp. f-mel]
MPIAESWATWCTHCVDAMPHLMKLQKKYKDSGLEIVGVAVDEETAQRPLRPKQS